MLGQWCSAGLQYDQFWPLTFAEIITILDGVADRQLRDHDMDRRRNHELAVLISHAFHNPKKMPDFKSSRKEPAAREKPREVDDAQVRGFFIGLAGKPKSTTG